MIIKRLNSVCKRSSQRKKREDGIMRNSMRVSSDF